MTQKISKTSTKSSIRIVITEEMRVAFNRLRATRYSFMKEDEIIKLAFSKLYSQEYSPVSSQTSLDVILTKLREKIPNFGEKWLIKNDRHEKELNVDSFCQMIADSVANLED
jgi:hypothetical protein